MTEEPASRQILHIGAALHQATKTINLVTAALEKQSRQISALSLPMAKQVHVLNLFIPRVSLPNPLLCYARLMEQAGEILFFGPFFSCISSLHKGDPEGIDFFLVHYCGMTRPTPEAYSVLWEVLKEKRWRNAESPDAYIKAAFWRQYKKQIAGMKEASLINGITTASIDAGAIVIPGRDELQDVNDRLLVEWALEKIQDPDTREAVRAYCLGERDSMRSAFNNNKNKQDTARRQLRALQELIKTGLR